MRRRRTGAAVLLEIALVRPLCRAYPPRGAGRGRPVASGRAGRLGRADVPGPGAFRCGRSRGRGCSGSVAPSRRAFPAFPAGWFRFIAICGASRPGGSCVRAPGFTDAGAGQKAACGNGSGNDW